MSIVKLEVFLVREHEYIRSISWKFLELDWDDMNTLFFTIQNRRFLKTLRLHYGLEGKKYIIQVYEGEINGHGEKEGLPTEFQYEFEQ